MVLAHALLAGLSRREMLQSLVLVLPITTSAANAAINIEAPQAASTSASALASLDSKEDVPAVLEGKAKQAVEQALKKSVDKTKVH